MDRSVRLTVWAKSGTRRSEWPFGLVAAARARYRARSRERRSIEKEVKRLEQEIQAAEQKITELTAELEKPETYEDPSRAVAINRELSTAQTTLDHLTPEWETAAKWLESI